jgi:hypothetical protein
MIATCQAVVPLAFMKFDVYHVSRAYAQFRPDIKENLNDGKNDAE